MQGELTNYCRRFYEMEKHLLNHDERFYKMIKKALPFNKQTKTGELDAIIKCNRKVQKAYEVIQDIIKAKNEAEKAILKIMEYFEVPKETKLTCVLPGEVELKIYADEDNRVHCIRSKSLKPLEDDPNHIIIRLVADQFDLDEDEEQYEKNRYENDFDEDDD